MMYIISKIIFYILNYIFLNPTDLYSFIDKKNLKKSFIKVVRDYYQRKTSFRLDNIIEHHNFNKKRRKKVMYLIIFKGNSVLTTSRIIYSGKNGYVNFIRTNRNYRGVGLQYVPPKDPLENICLGVKLGLNCDFKVG